MKVSVGVNDKFIPKGATEYCIFDKFKVYSVLEREREYAIREDEGFEKAHLVYQFKTTFAFGIVPISRVLDLRTVDPINEQLS
ncbi:hypothetical protein NX059_008745 [Plenodomus lindquistii]|nr:hypothetical protein NX059_008745 [Plenodomus lindquistii]